MNANIETASKENFAGYRLSFVDFTKSPKEQMKMEVMRIYTYQEHSIASYTLGKYEKNSPVSTSFSKEKIKIAIIKIYFWPEYHVAGNAKNSHASTLSPKEQMKTDAMRM